MSDEGVPVEDEGMDPGLARERTELAWNRSGLAVAVTVAIIVRRLWPLSSNGAILVLLLIAFGAAVWVVAMRIGRSARDRSADSGALAESTCRMLTIGTLLLAGSAFVVGLS
jgi:hypothetical protein